MKEAREVLQAAHNLISDPSAWTQKQTAQTRYGGSCGALHANASKWCATGALAHAAAKHDGAVEMRAAISQLMSALERKFFLPENAYKRLASFNDTHTHAEVLALFDRAIAACDALP